MQFGIYAPLPHVTVGSPAIAQSIAGAQTDLPTHAVDPAYQLAKDVLCEADACGFDIILFAERHLGADLEAWVLGGAISAMTQQIRAMIAVHPGLWRPELIAKMAATLDRLNPGRMAINLVTGWNVEEHEMFGGDTMLGNDERYIRAEEFSDVLRGMWSETPFSYEGAYFKVSNAQLLLKPSMQPPPEIFTASRSPRGLDMVAKKADWWFLDYDKEASNLIERMDSLRRSIDDMDKRAARFGRKVRYAFNPFVAFGDTDEAAIQKTVRLLSANEPNADDRKIMQRVGPAMKCGCIGAPGRVLEQVMKYRDMGIELLLLKFVPTVEEVQMIRDNIIVPLRR